jgi:nucleoside triphosphate pyrophosphatase
VSEGARHFRLILASASPRRRELLRGTGFHFEVRPSSIIEDRRAGESGEEFAGRAAREKALDVAASVPRDSLVLAADTVVMVGSKVLGKPTDSEDAARMLRLLSGQTHSVITAVCLVRAPARVEALDASTTLVTFRPLDEREIQEYVASGEPLDKAGAYGIQGLASRFVTRIEGSYSNVVGLPVALVCDMLKKAGVGVQGPVSGEPGWG